MADAARMQCSAVADTSIAQKSRRSRQGTRGPGLDVCRLPTSAPPGIAYDVWVVVVVSGTVVVTGQALNTGSVGVIGVCECCLDCDDGD